jgi:hypothetical protein
MKTPNPDHPIRNALKHFALTSTMGAAMFFGASPASATPVTTGLTLWLDAGDATTMTIDGSGVAEWRDKNGSAAKMTRQAGTPTVVASGIGGLPTVSFNTSSRMNDGVNHAAPVTIFYVSRQTGGANNRVLSATNNNWLLGYWNGNKGSAYFTNDNLLGGNGSSDTAPHLYTATIGGSGQNSTVWAEGFQIASNQNGTAGPNNLQLNGYEGGNELSDCDISEVLVYNRILNSTELVAVGGYLTAKYGLTTNYPTSLTVALTSPANNQAYLSGTSVSATAAVAAGTAPYTVKFFTRTLPGGTFAQVGSDLTNAPYTLDLGTLSDGSYEINATVTDSAGVPVTATSATHTFAVAPPTATTTTVVSSGSPSIYGDSVTFTATVTPIPTGGTVQFFSGFDFIGSPVPVNPTTGVASVTTTTLGATTHEITAAYNGFQVYETSTSGPISQVVDKAPLTVTAQNVSRFVNTANPTLTAQITGFKNGQTLGTSGVSGTPDLSTTAVPASPLGAYPITCTLGSLAAINYSFTSFVDATLSVVPVTSLAINVNLDSTVRTGLEGPAGGLGETWNTVSTTSASNLSVASGPASTVGYTTTGTGGWGNPGETANFDPTLLLLKEGSTNFDANGTTQQLVINGLDPAKTYDLYIASSILITTNQRNRGEWSTTNTTSTVGSQVSDNRLNQNSSTWVRGNNYVLFEDVVPSVSGNITVNGFAITEQPTYDIRLALNGFQLIESAPTGGFAGWASANGATGQTPQQDHDNDGVENGIEYFMGETGSSFTSMPVLDENNMITWPAEDGYEGTYEVQTSTNLATWTNVDPRPAISGGLLSYLLPPGAPGGKSFVRLLVTPTP